MKILITQETDWLARNPAQQHHLAERLSLRGHEIRVIDHQLLWQSQDGKKLRSRRQVFDKVAKIYSGANVTVIRPGIIRLPWLDYISLLISHRQEITLQIHEFAPDVIVGFGILNSCSAARAVAKTNVPFLYYWIDALHMLIPSKIFQPIGKAIESMTLRKSDGILVINEMLKEYVIRLGAPPARTQVLRAGIDSKQFDSTRSGDPVRTQYGFTQDDTVLFFMGWLYEFSGLKEVAREIAASNNPHLKLLVVGEGDAYDELQQIRRESNLEKQVILTGKKNYRELPEFIASADVCLLPAYPEEKIMQDIVPIKMYEYMAMAKPVIATRLHGVMKEFGDDNGVVYVDRPEDAVRKAVELMQGGRTSELGAKARTFALKNSWDNITDEFERILERAIKDKSGRGEWI